MSRVLRCARTTVLGGIAVLLGLGISTRARGEDEPPKASRWVSTDTVIYLEATRPSALIDRALGQSFQDALTGIPGYSEGLAADQIKTVRAIADLIAGRLGTTWEKGLRDLSGGGIVLAVEAEAGQPPRIILVVTPTSADLLKRGTETLVELARQDAAEKGRPDPLKSAEYRGVTGYGTDKGAYAIVEGALVIANNPEALKAVIDRTLDGAKAGATLAENPAWKARRAAVGPDSPLWGFARLDRLRALDPNKFGFNAKNPVPLTFLFGSWIDALKSAGWISASLRWSEERLGLDVTLPVPRGGYGDALKGYLPPKGDGAPSLVKPQGTIASFSLWRDLSAIWEARTNLFPPEVVQGLAKLDGFAGQFFGGRDFGTGVLGSLSDNWRLVVANQDYQALKPVPDEKLPAFALVVDLKPDDDFAQRLRVAFQSFVGLANLGAAQTKAPPLELGSETFEGVTISTSRFMPAKTDPAAKEPVHRRHNFSPSAAQVDSHFILSSSLGLTRDLIKSLRSPAKPNAATLAAEADGRELARFIGINRKRLVMQNMLEKGHDKTKAEGEIGVLVGLLNYLGHARLSVQDGPETVRLALDFALTR